MTSELYIMLRQWAQTNVPRFGFLYEALAIKPMRVADQTIGDEGGFFMLYMAELFVSHHRGYPRMLMETQESERLLRFEWVSLCHDIWMTKNVVVVGSLTVT